MVNNEQEKKDPMILFKNTRVQENDRGGEHISLSLVPEQAAALIEALEGALAEAGTDPMKRVGVDVHTSTKQGPSGPFLSSIAFVKVIQLKERNSKYPSNNKNQQRGYSNNNGGGGYNKQQTASAISKVTQQGYNKK